VGAHPQRAAADTSTSLPEGVAIFVVTYTRIGRQLSTATPVPATLSSGESAQRRGPGQALLLRVALCQPVDEGKDFRDRLIDFRWDLLGEVEMREDFDEVFIFADGDVVRSGHL
jgi:hypothetical protein